jgi:hypothetical protein
MIQVSKFSGFANQLGFDEYGSSECTRFQFTCSTKDDSRIFIWAESTDVTHLG